VIYAGWKVSYDRVGGWAATRHGVEIVAESREVLANEINERNARERRVGELAAFDQLKARGS
jgi:hypothetical protein